jgi:hypothetical protein
MIRASDFRPMERNSLRGFVTLALDPSGLVLRDCTLHRKDGKEWIGLPGKPQIDTEGKHRRDPVTGKPLYTAVVEVVGREARDRFQEAALAAVHRLLDAEAVR